MDLLKQFSGYCKIALPFLGMAYAAMLMYFDGPKDSWVFVKQGVPFILFGVWAYIMVFASPAS